MEKPINIHIEKLPEGVYLATSDDIQGRVAQGRTATEALEIARDVARKPIEAKNERSSDITGRNPKTGVTVELAPKKLPFFKCGKELKDRMNK